MARYSRAKYLAVRVAMMPSDASGQGHISGGVILSYLDIAGAKSARRAFGPGVILRMVTRAMDMVEFRKPVMVDDTLTCWGRVTRVGKTSVHVHVTAEVERNGIIIPVTQADMVFVHVDSNDNPLAIPGAPKSRRAPAPIIRSEPEKPIGERILAIRKTMYPFELNGMGNIFGGVLLTYMDQAGLYTASRVCPNQYIHRCATRLMDRVEFKQPVKVNDTLTCWGSLVRLGETSIKVHVDAEVDRGGRIIPVTSADLVFVALDEQGSPTRVACSTAKPSTTCGA